MGGPCLHAVGGVQLDRDEEDEAGQDGQRVVRVGHCQVLVPGKADAADHERWHLRARIREVERPGGRLLLRHPEGQLALFF